MSAVGAALIEYCLPGDPTPHYQTVFDGNQEVPLPSNAIDCSQNYTATAHQVSAISTLPQVGSDTDILLASTIAVIAMWVVWRKGHNEENTTY